MKPTVCKFLSLLLAGVLLLTPAVPALAAEGSDTVRLRTADDLVQLSRSCTLDSWSRGKTVILEADIDLSGRDFAPIPTFGGTFEGQGHTISGLSITGSGNVRGLFRYIQSTGVVRDLTVKGLIDPSDRKNTLGGLAGSNQGLLSNCTFVGSVSGADSIGGLVGVNAAQGQLIHCSFSGSVTGEHYVGGIAGQNFGSIIQCGNSGAVNTTEVEAEVDLEEMNREQLNAAENVPVCTDIGGITGFSSGILQSCTNTGAVGYAHIGYNIGGITGRQSGYLNGCSNSGTVLGRKDVGGIAGQLEPEVRLLYNEGQVGGLLDQLDVLRGMLDQTRADIRDTSDALSRQMQAVSDRTGAAQEALGSLADAAGGWTDETIEAVNGFSARISWLVDEMTPILSDTAGAMDLAETLAKQMENALNEALAAGDLGAGAAAELEDALQAFRTALDQGRASRARVQSALSHLKRTLERGEDTAPALEEFFSSSRTLWEDCAQIASSAGRVLELLWSAGDPEGQAALRQALSALRDAFSQAADALPDTGAALVRLAGTLIHPEELSAAREDVRAAAETLAAAAEALARGMENGQDAVRALGEFLEQTDGAGTALGNAVGTAEALFSRGAGIGRDLSEVFRELSQLPAITLQPLDSSIQAQRDALGTAFSGLLADGDTLRETMSGSTDILLDDLEDLNAQFGVITDLLRQILTDPEAASEDRFEDVSDQEGSTGTGSLSDARNTGTVEGDINVGGIVGSMAVEYDFDPEDDLIREGDRSLDVRYQTRAVVTACVNTGTVTGKQNYVGGVAGLMDLGRVSGCENYGDLSSTNGDYVGGIAGASWGSIRACWSKGHLSGGDYIGGVAGLGATITDCHTLTAIDAGSAYLGAVAGDVEQDGVVSGNTFTSDRLGGLDGVSYAGRAEPVSFADLCAVPGIPAQFSRLELTFVADGKVVAVVPFSYGGGIDSIPEIPAKKGYSAAWPELDYTHLTASQTLEAVYTPYSSALSDGGDLPEILVDGSFSSRASVRHTTEPVSWTDPSGRRHSGTSYTVTVEDPDLSQVSYTIHCRLSDPDGHYALWILGEDGWTQADYEIDGRYLLISCQTGTVTFCITEQDSALLVWGAAALGGLVLLVAVHGVRRLRDKCRQKRGSAPS